MLEAPLEIDVEQYYLRYGPMVMRRCRALLANESEAAEAMQETFVRVLENHSRLRDGAPSSLLFRIATHVCLNMIRKSKKTITENTKLVEIARYHEPLSGWSSISIIQRMFARQHELNAYIAVLFYLDGMTQEEVACEVNLSVSGVRKRLRQIQQKAVRFKELA